MKFGSIIYQFDQNVLAPPLLTQPSLGSVSLRLHLHLVRLLLPSQPCTTTDSAAVTPAILCGPESILLAFKSVSVPHRTQGRSSGTKQTLFVVGHESILSGAAGPLQLTSGKKASGLPALGFQNGQDHVISVNISPTPVSDSFSCLYP